MQTSHLRSTTVPTRAAQLLGVLTFASLATAQQDPFTASQSPVNPAAAAAGAVTFAWSDYDQDGLLDAAAVQPDGSLSLLKNLGDGSFADVSTSVGIDAQHVSFVLFEDGNGDGLADLFVVSKAPGGSQLLLNASGTFQSATVGSGLESLAGVQEAQWLDYDADGQLDLHVVTQGANTLFHALGTARFEPIDLPVAHAGQVSAFTVGALGLLTEKAAGQVAVDAPGADVDIDNVLFAAGQSGRTPVGGGLGNGPGTQNMGTIVPGWPQCTRLITDDATGNCMGASSTATLGMLYPLSTSFFVDDANGRVGIGSATPGRTLDVLGNTSGSMARFRNTNLFGSSSAEFTDESGSPRAEFGYSNFFDAVAWAGSTFLAANGTDLVVATSDTERLRVTQGGNVGIGTTNPGSLLTVDATGNSGVLSVVQPGSSTGTLQLGSPGGHPGLSVTTNDNQSTHAITFEDDGIGIDAQGGGPDLYVENGGNVGIGTTNPGMPLAIVGSPGFGNVLQMHSDKGSNWHLSFGTGYLEFVESGVGANRLVLQDGGNIGIGTNNPAQKLTVNGGGFEVDPGGDGLRVFKVSTPSGHIGFSGFTPAGTRWDTEYQDSRMVMGTGPAPNDLTILTTGNVGIGTTSPTQLLSVNGSAGKPGGGSWSNFSDRRLKKNVEDLDGALETLLELRGVTFEYKDPEAINELAGERIGFIAQEVEAVLPDWVEEAGDYKMLTIRGFEALAVEAIRELHAKDAENDELHAEMKELRAEVERLRSMSERIEALESALHEVLATR